MPTSAFAWLRGSIGRGAGVLPRANRATEWAGTNQQACSSLRASLPLRARRPPKKGCRRRPEPATSNGALGSRVSDAHSVRVACARIVGEDLPCFVAPMLARAGTPTDHAGWAYEVKFDGMRAQLRLEGGKLCLRSRPGRDCTDAFPELAPLSAGLRRRRLLLDGELVCLTAEGDPDFARLRARLRSSGSEAAIAARRSPATFIAFDLLHLDGSSTASSPTPSGVSYSPSSRSTGPAGIRRAPSRRTRAPRCSRRRASAGWRGVSRTGSRRPTCRVCAARRG